MVRVNRTIAKVLKTGPTIGILSFNLSSHICPVSVRKYCRAAVPMMRETANPSHQKLANASEIPIKICVGTGNSRPNSRNIAVNLGMTKIIKTATAIINQPEQDRWVEQAETTWFLRETLSFGEIGETFQNFA